MLQTAVVYDSLASSPAFAAFNVLLYEFGVQVPEHALSLAAAPTALPPDAVSFVAQDILAALRTLAYLPNDEELAQGVKSEKLHLVGCSMSAMSTLVMAALLGDVVETVMLISPLALGLTVSRVPDLPALPPLNSEPI
jgi:pimeloyl-ACP methyl ester carboxylesterase